MQVVDVHGGFKKFVVSLLVMRTFLNSSSASTTCADLRDPTAVSRFNYLGKMSLISMPVNGSITQDFLRKIITLELKKPTKAG